MHIRPDILKKNDKIGIVATAKKVTPEELETAINCFQSWGLEIVLGSHVYDSFNQFAGEDIHRLADIQEMIDNPEIKAIICARGGYGTTRIIDKIDFSALKNTPKWIVGFSDITVLLYQLFNIGIESVHGIMAGLFHKEGTKESIESLKNILFGAPIHLKSAGNPLNQTGEANGMVIGGNLSIVNNIIGTASDVDMKDKLLFLEDLDEYLYHIDRMMVHLKRAGKLHQLGGLIIGDMSDMNDNPIPFGSAAYEIIHEHVRDYDYPVCYGFPVGHEARNLAIPCGRLAKLRVTKNESELLFKE